MQKTECARKTAGRSQRFGDRERTSQRDEKRGGRGRREKKAATEERQGE